MKKIVFIVGSLRAKSFNRQLARDAEAMLADRAEVSYLDYSELPWVNQDTEFPTPETVSLVRKAIAEADGLWIFTPEYNSSYPGHLKNLFDWLSRPVKPMDYATPTCIAGKPVAISGAGGKAATANCRLKLTKLLTFIRADVMQEPQTGIALAPEAWTTDVLVLTTEQKNALSEQADSFLKHISKKP